MIKQAPKPLQIVAMVTFVMACVGVLLYLWLSFGGVIPLRSEGYRIQVQFPEAVQLAEQSDVRISGVPVGKVVKIEPGPENTTEATLEMRSRYAPVPKNARAMLRQKSLLGETYVDLTVGDRTQGVIPDGGSLARSSVHETVELDEIFRTFDDDTQQAFQVWMQSQASAVNGRAADINATFGTFPTFVEASDDILAELHAQERAVSDTIRGTGKFFSALSERDGQLSRLITESNRLFQTIAGRNQDFAAIWRELPEFSRQSRLTLPRLTRFAENADPVVKALQPAATEFAGTFNELDKLAPEFRGFFEGLGPVITKSEKGVPALESLLRDFPPLLAEFEPFLQNFNPILAHLGENRREITSFFGNVTAASNAWNPMLDPSVRDVDRIYALRATQTLNPSSLTYFPRTLGQTRANAFMAPGGLDRLAGGLASFETSQCGNGDPAPPAQTGSPELVELARLATDFAFKPTGDRNVPRPPCVAQGNYPGFDTQYPQIRAEP
ncbi:MAG: MCE family protein [Solirubrobacterales bacterium]|nr:MCE family protein [Solirubrobacterales bacterium]